jgi:hypothetical protein
MPSFLTHPAAKRDYVYSIKETSCPHREFPAALFCNMNNSVRKPADWRVFLHLFRLESKKKTGKFGLPAFIG